IPTPAQRRSLWQSMPATHWQRLIGCWRRSRRRENIRRLIFGACAPPSMAPNDILQGGRIKMDDDKLAIEEARRAGQHGSVKAQVESEVHAEIAESAATTPAPEIGRAA